MQSVQCLVFRIRRIQSVAFVIDSSCCVQSIGMIGIGMLLCWIIVTEMPLRICACFVFLPGHEWSGEHVYCSILKGNSHQILLSEMSLPGVEVLIEKLLPTIIGRLGKKNPS